MPGLRVTAVNAGPLNPDKNKLVAFAPGTVSVPTTVGIIEHPKHGLILWDTGINHAVADPERADAYWGASLRDAFGAHGFTRPHAVDAQLDKLGMRTADARYVVYSHLHFDHAGGMSYFPTRSMSSSATRSATRSGPTHEPARPFARTTSSR